MSRWRITIRSEGTELRGCLTTDLEGLQQFAKDMKPWGLVIGSPADDDYNPFIDRDEITFLADLAEDYENRPLAEKLRAMKADL